MIEKIVSALIRAAILVTLALGGFQFFYSLGHKHGLKEGHAEERLAVARENHAALTVADKAAAALQSKIDQLAGQATQTENARQTAARENRNASQSVLARPVYRTVCVDPDGVRLLDQAADIANGHPPGAGLALPAVRTAGPAETATH